MMPSRYSRRSALALLGGVAFAGCSSLTDDRYWDDPPSFDATGMESVTRQSTPERPDPIPIAVTEMQREAFRNRVADLMAPIPEPLTETAVPNGEIRRAIVTHRRDAREALDRMLAVPDTLSRVAAAADAGQYAAETAGIWAAITTTGSPETVTSSASELQSEISRLLSALPDVATGPTAGAVVYGSIEAWLDEARRSTLVGRPTSIEAQANPLRVGWLLGDLERIRLEITAGEHIRDQYMGAIEQPRQIAEELSSAASELAPQMEARFEELHGTETDRPRIQAPDLDGLLERRYQRDEPGVRLFADKLYDFFDEVRFVAIAWPGIENETASVRVRNTYWAFAVLDAIDDLRTRVNDGEDMFPPDATTIRETRSRAIDAVMTLGRSTSPLEQWLAWRLTPKFAAPDDVIDSSTADDSERRNIAGAYGEYVWIRTVARAGAETTPTITSAFTTEVE